MGESYTPSCRRRRTARAHSQMDELHDKHGSRGNALARAIKYQIGRWDMTDNVNPRIELQLHPDGVAAPAHIAAQTCREIVDFYFAALATADLSKNPPAPEGTFFRFGFSGPELSTTDRRSLHENWLLAKVFQDLMRGVRASLEEAFFFTELIAAGTITAQSSSTLDEILAPFRKKAADLRFPPLLAEVNKRLERPLEFTDAYQSMQAARNCLEHRAGIVAKSDAG